jgi:hypothetical protein
MACSENLFGSPSNSNCGTDIKCLRLDAENAFRNGNYAKAYDIYSKIVNIDSTASVGYFGMAKAGLWMKGINPFDVFAQVKTGTKEIAFMNDPPVEQNKFYQGMRFIAPALRELENRDTLTAHYDYHIRNINSDLDTTFVRTLDSASWARAVAANGFDIARIESIDKGDGKNKIYRIPISEKLKKFRKTYCNNGRSCSNIPLSDREYSYNSYTAGLLITTISETILKSMDTNRDGCIAKSCPALANCAEYNPGEITNLQAWINWGCDIKNKYSYDLSINLVVNDLGEFEVDINQLLDGLDLGSFYQEQLRDNRNATLPEDIQSFNDNMDEFSGSIYEILSVMDIFKDRSSDGEVPFGWESDIGGYKDYSTFYKMGTNIDEDGDGCIGEEILDGQDNDRDGFIDENARLAPLERDSPYYADDGLLPPGSHGMTGNPNDDKFITYEDGITTEIAFTQRLYPPYYWTSLNRDDKLMVAQDTACPPKISLEERKELIGGCWLNYNEDKFVRYWLKRELARPADRINRVHSTCKSCIGAGCLRR